MVETILSMALALGGTMLAFWGSLALLAWLGYRFTGSGTVGALCVFAGFVLWAFVIDAMEARPGSFAGHECTDDCSGHRAGYEWAAENGVDVETDCEGSSDSFIEGCQAYVDDPDRDPTVDDDGEDIPES